MKRTEHKTQRKRTFVLPDYTRKLSRQSKNRFTTALCSNNTGAFIVPLLVIRKICTDDNRNLQSLVETFQQLVLKKFGNERISDISQTIQITITLAKIAA
ncbi:Protein ApaG [Trichinella pseudospiralis]